MRKLFDWIGFLLTGFPSDDLLRPSTVRTLRAVMVAFCVVATVFVIVALLLGVRP